jgi:hypothetical protein
LGALAGFAANSLLTRVAIGPGLIDSVSFSTIRLATGAVGAVILLNERLTMRLVAVGTWIAAVSCS